METVKINNKGPDIESTNFWDLFLAREGFLYLSIHDGVARLLVPPDYTEVLMNMTLGCRAILTKGIWNGYDAYEIMFEMRRHEPYAVFIRTRHVDHPLTETDLNKEFTLTIWTREGKQAEMPARYRTAEKLPFMQPYHD